ncbi:MAG: VacJ family lipoprotein [Nitrospira sp.]|nr:VacJ family lipoprotein [Nitrospira sp.]
MHRTSGNVSWLVGMVYVVGVVIIVGCAGGPSRSEPISSVGAEAALGVDSAKSAVRQPLVETGPLASPNPATQANIKPEADATEAGDEPPDDPFFDPFAKHDDVAGGNEYDPWEPVNTKVFEFNRQVDRWILKPIAQGYNALVPNPVQIGISNVFYNIRFPSRLINNLAQGKLTGAGAEAGRFLLNSSFGLGGLVDVATHMDITTPEEDTGQTLGYYGVQPGPYLVVPFLPPFTLRDFFGYLGDIALNPINWMVFPIIEINGIPSLVAHTNRTTSTIAQTGMRVGEIVNERSLNLEKFQGVEEATLDLYTAVKNAYIQKRRNQIRD